MESPPVDRDASAACGELRADTTSTDGVRLIVLNLPEDEGEGLGFRLTRTLWDPYPWVREVVPGSRADSAGLRPGDCLLQADGKDLLGMPIGQVAGVIRGDGGDHGVALLCWNCGVDPRDDPELLWSCGGGARGERARRALDGVVRALACCVCAATAPASAALSCARSHLYCEPCWSRLERCALCRESLPPKDSSYARNLVAEQVFEAIASEYEVKGAQRRLRAPSAHGPPSRSSSPVAGRGGQYQLSMLAQRRARLAPCADKFASDPNIRRSCAREARRITLTPGYTNACDCQPQNNSTDVYGTIPTINVQPADADSGNERRCPAGCPGALPHELVARVRHACSLVDLQHSNNSIDSHEQRSGGKTHSSSMDNLKISIGSSRESPVFVVTTPPIYVLTCDHNKT